MKINNPRLEGPSHHFLLLKYGYAMATRSKNPQQFQPCIEPILVSIPKSDIAVLFLEGCYKSAWSPTALHDIGFLAFTSNNLEACTSHTHVSSSVIIAAWQYTVIPITVWFAAWSTHLRSTLFESTHFLHIWFKWQQLPSWSTQNLKKRRLECQVVLQ